MKMNTLGRDGPKVSELCLGTMTFGTQTSEADAHAQIDASLSAGINFLDTAEMYPTTPVSADTVGLTEKIIGTWNAANKSRRGEFVLATKVSGAGLKAVRDGAPISAATIDEALHASLRYLQTDYVDIYQLHWPNRGSYHFRQNWGYDPSSQDRAAVLEDMGATLDALADHVKAGKIRYIGLSNETTWGTAQWLQLAEQTDGPRVVSVQNEYSLLCRHYDTDMAELSVNESVGLLAYSPLAAGLLTGKYQTGAIPEGSRRAINEGLGGRITPRVFDAVDAYAEVAEKHGLDLTQMSLAFAASRPFMGSVIFGATTTAQLEHILEGSGLRLSDEVIDDINAVYKAHPLPF